METITHPQNVNSTIRGMRLAPGTVIEKGDVYDCLNGTWQPCHFVGGRIPDRTQVIWVRPEALPKNEHNSK